MSPIAYRPASESDLGPLLDVQREAFRRVAVEFGIDEDDLPPLQETLTDLEALMAAGSLFFVAIDGDRVIGGVRAGITGDTAHIGRLVVSTGHLRRGVATGLMETLESACSGVRRYELFTGQEATAPLSLYRKLGYTVTHTECVNSVPLVWLAKECGS